MQKIALKRILSLGRENDISKAQFQAHLLDDIFRVGCFSQLIWFQKSLKYLSKDKLNEKKRILVAAGLQGLQGEGPRHRSIYEPALRKWVLLKMLWFW